ncbi:HAMP domain-containing sensor histidine kinase [Massilia sp. ST3]|uniref:sensor histidine kinase n=1 Tax=Massilia sp. ST3 TaxID=2824903 RepID=UPI001B82528E|nr:HAMP domain-containing histidine kinase [Massilia sp. ST3]MBQ5948714.1 HAMP domain-containing histidine kinase [Massilia sp. ST3]
MARTIRQGLFSALAGFTVLICLCYTGLAVVIAYVTEDMLVERLLEREARAVARHVALHGSVPAARNELITVHTSFASLPAAVRQAVGPSERRAEVFAGASRHYHLMALEPGAQRIYLLADVAPLLVVSKVIQDVGGVLVFVALGLIGLALLLAWLLARRLVLPLQALAAEARALRPGEPIAFSARGRPDEIGYLAERLESGFSALQAALQREHDFTRDVGHELRTPLTIMNNTLAMAPPLGGAETAQLRASLDEIRNTVDVLFALARAEQVGAETFDLRACIEQCLLRVLEQGGRDASRWHIDLPDRLDASGNPHLAALLVNNCVGNALFHGGPDARLDIQWTGGRLVIANSLAPGGPRRVQGFSHGQDLLARIARALRWELAFHPGPSSYRVEIRPDFTAISPRPE